MERKISSEKGKELEDKIELFFRINGYETIRNIILEGRSGARHEVDILAKKADEITTVKIMVECKAWDKPIEKDIVTKVNYVLRDLGIDKGIIVALNGYRSGAETTAKELGIELWGKDEIEKNLGKITVSELEIRGFKKIIKGFPVDMEKFNAISIVEEEAKGFLGFKKEKLEFTELVWLPCYLFKILQARQTGTISKKIINTPSWNLYDALEGNCFCTFENEPKLEDINADKIIRPLIKEKVVKSNLFKVLKKMHEVTTKRSKARYESQLVELGIYVPVYNISIENIQEIYYPFYIGLLRKDDEQRIIAISGVNKKISKTISSTLTANLGHVLESIK